MIPVIIYPDAKVSAFFCTNPMILLMPEIMIGNVNVLIPARTL
jgi:hypothetical protein